METAMIAAVVPMLIIGGLFFCCLSDWLNGRFVDNDEDNRARARTRATRRQDEGGEDD